MFKKALLTLSLVVSSLSFASENGKKPEQPRTGNDHRANQQPYIDVNAQFLPNNVRQKQDNNGTYVNEYYTVGNQIKSRQVSNNNDCILN